MSFPPKKPWNRQPPYWVPADPRWGATSVWNALYPLIDAVDGKPFTVTGTMPGIDGTTRGAGFRSMSGTYFQRSDIDNTGPAISVIAVYRPLDTNSYNTICGNGSAGAGYGWKVSADYNASTNWQQIATFGGVADYPLEIPTWTTVGQTRVAGFRISGNGGTYSAYNNGALIGSTAVGTMATPPGSPYTIGAYYAGSYTAILAGTAPIIIFFNRALPDAQMRELTENPWQIFRPLTQRIWVSSAGVSNDITAAGSLSITGAADLDAIGSLLAAGALSIAGAADLDAAGTLVVVGALSVAGSADLDAIGALLVAGSIFITGAADLDAPGTLVAAGALSISGVATLDVVAQLIAAGSIFITGAADLDATGSLLALGALSISGVAVISDANATTFSVYVWERTA